jgi:hypothetical protein
MENWTYSRSFDMSTVPYGPGFKTLLVLDGVDTVADVSLNGQLLGATNNMFRQYILEIPYTILRPQNNILTVRAVLAFRFTSRCDPAGFPSHLAEGLVDLTTCCYLVCIRISGNIRGSNGKPIPLRAPLC